MCVRSYPPEQMHEDETLWYFLRLERVPETSDDTLYTLSDSAKVVCGGGSGAATSTSRRLSNNANAGNSNVLVGAAEADATSAEPKQRVRALTGQGGSSSGPMPVAAAHRDSVDGKNTSSSSIEVSDSESDLVITSEDVSKALAGRGAKKQNKFATLFRPKSHSGSSSPTSTRDKRWLFGAREKKKDKNAVESGGDGDSSEGVTSADMLDGSSASARRANQTVGRTSGREVAGVVVERGASQELVRRRSFSQADASSPRVSVMGLFAPSSPRSEGASVSASTSAATSPRTLNASAASASSATTTPRSLHGSGLAGSGLAGAPPAQPAAVAAPVPAPTVTVTASDVPASPVAVAVASPAASLDAPSPASPAAVAVSSPAASLPAAANGSSPVSQLPVNVSSSDSMDSDNERDSAAFKRHL